MTTAACMPTGLPLITGYKVQVVGSTKVGEHVEYCIESSTPDGDTWIVHRRFRDLFELHHLLRIHHGKRLPQLPSRRAYGFGKLIYGEQSPAFTAERQVEMERYLKGVLRLDPAISAVVLKEFLGAPALDKRLSLGYGPSLPPSSEVGTRTPHLNFDARLMRTLVSTLSRQKTTLTNMPLSVVELHGVALHTSAFAGSMATCQYRATSRTVAEHLRQQVPRLFSETSSIYVCSMWNELVQGPAILSFCPHSSAWLELPMPPVPGFLAMASTGGQLYVMSDGDPCSANSERFFKRWNTLEKRWHVLPQRPGPRLTRYAMSSSGGAIYLFGGEGGAGYLSRSLSFDTFSQCWQQLPDMPTFRADCAATSLGGMLFIVGGNSAGAEPCDAVESFLPRTEGWSILPPLTFARHSAAVAATNGSLFVFGGSAIAQHHLLAHAISPPEPLRLDLGTGIWEALDGPNSLRRRTCGVAAIAGVVYVFGGAADRDAHAHIDRFDAKANSWDVVAHSVDLQGVCAATIVAS